jgi:hypothetical protein
VEKKASDGLLCELDNNGGTPTGDYFEFIPSTFKDHVPDASDLFTVPGDCNTWCGAKGSCALG